MGKLDDLNFVKKAPEIKSVAAGHSPMDRARKKLLVEIEHQIQLATDPNYEIVTENRKGETKRRKPKSWVVIAGDSAFITIRYSNIAMPLGGKRGSVIKCSATNVAGALRTVRDAISDGEVDEVIGKMIAKAKRKPRGKKKPVTSPAAAEAPTAS